MKRIIMVLGDHYHEARPFRELLKQIFSEILTEVQLTEVSINELKKVLNANPDLVILAKENRLEPEIDETKVWLTSEMDQLITDYVLKGGNWLAWHAGLSSYPVESAYVKMLRGYFQYHPREYPTVSYTTLDEISNFVCKDEQYFTITEDVTPFMWSESSYGIAPAGWEHDYGKGKILCFCPPHTKEGFSNQQLKKVLSIHVKKII